jgi:hypothetical protein
MAEQQARQAGAQEGRIRVVVEVGNESFEPGRTRADIGPDGQVALLSRLEGAETRAETRLEPERLTRLVDDFAAADQGVAREPGRPGLPDEPLYHIEVYRNDVRVNEMNVWRSQLQRSPGLSRLIQTLQELAERASDGKIVV